MDFDRWLNGQGRGETEEVDDSVSLECSGCGRFEYVSLAELENGDSGWVSYEKLEPGDYDPHARCCGSDRCLP
jgi:hypothetical protein